jgi:hypothetical protein
MNSMEIVLGIMAWIWVLGCGAISLVRDEATHKRLFWIITGLFILTSIIFFALGVRPR